MRASDSVDAVVIGAGHNGLVAATVLADAGWDVLVCEATEHAGGAVRSAEVTSPGFVTDLFSGFYPLTIASPVMTALGLHQHGLRWTHAPAVLAHVFPDDRCALLSRDVEVTAASLEEFGVGDGLAWRRFVEQFESISGPLLRSLFTPLPAARPLVGLARSLGVAGGLRLARMAAQPVRRMSDETFAGAGGGMLLAGNALHADLPPDGAGSALYGWLLTMLGQTVGFPVPVGGSSAITQALLSRLAAAGGRVRLSSPVISVEVSNGTATGIRLAGGELIRAARAVLADVAAPLLYTRLLDASEMSSRLRDDLQRFEWDLPTLKMNWALSGPVPWTSSAARQAGTVHLGVDLNGLSDYSTDLVTGRVPQRPFVLFGQTTTADPTRSPEGTESAWAYTHLPRGLTLTEQDIDRQVNLVEQLLERHAPGFRASILTRHLQSPHDLERAEPNLIDGAVNGGTAQLHQQLIFRPTPGLGGATTVVDRLYLAGSSAHPGGGVHGGPGANAARAALKRDGWLGPLRRQATRAAFSAIYR